MGHGKTLQHTLKIQQCELLVWCFKYYGSVHGTEITQQMTLSDFEHICVSEHFSCAKIDPPHKCGISRC